MKEKVGPDLHVHVRTCIIQCNVKKKLYATMLWQTRSNKSLACGLNAMQYSTCSHTLTHSTGSPLGSHYSSL